MVANVSQCKIYSTRSYIHTQCVRARPRSSVHLICIVRCRVLDLDCEFLETRYAAPEELVDTFDDAVCLGERRA